MKSKSFVKFLVLAGVLCLVMGMASVAMAAMSITRIEPQAGQPLIDAQGNVKIKANISGLTAGEQITIKLEDYDAILSGSVATSTIKYIDQYSVTSGDVTAGFVNLPAFKAKDADATLKTTYLLSIGGTSVSSAYTQTIFKLADVIDYSNFTPTKAWVVGPEALKVNQAVVYDLKTVNATGRFGPAGDTGWTVSINPANGTVSKQGNAIFVTFTAAGTYALSATKAGVTSIPLNNIEVLASDATAVPYLNNATITNSTKGVKIGANSVRLLPTGAYLNATPIAHSAGSVSLRIPPAPTGATNTIKIGPVSGDAVSTGILNNTNDSTSNTKDATWTPSNAGRYKMIIETTAGDVTTTKTVYFAVLTNTEIGQIHDRASDLEASDITVETADSGSKIALTFARKLGNTYDYWILPMSGTIGVDGTYTAQASDRANWDKLTVTTNPNSDSSTFTKPSIAGDYRISIYAKHSATVGHVDTYRIITLRIDSNGNVSKHNGNGTFTGVDAQ